MKAGEGTAIESCTNVGVGNTTEFIVELSLDDCSQFGSESQCVWEEEREIGRGEDNRREKEERGGKERERGKRIHRENSKA